MENQALAILLESVLGKGEKTSKGNHIYVCPFHVSNPPGKKKLEINLKTDDKKQNPFHCWACGVKGKTIKAMFKKMNIAPNKMNELGLIIQPGEKIEYSHDGILELPPEFILLNDLDSLDKLSRIESKHALNYLKSRNISSEDIIKYNIGFCPKGPYGHRVIIPSYDAKGRLNYFIARDYSENALQKYKNPPTTLKNIIGWELYINWDAPIIICEGMFDSLTIKRNVIPLFGKVIHDVLMQKLVKSSVSRIYIALDPDAIKDASKYCEQLMSYGKEVYLVELDGKDANAIGFERFLNIVENSQPLTFQTLLVRKIETI